MSANGGSLAFDLVGVAKRRCRYLCVMTNSVKAIVIRNSNADENAGAERCGLVDLIRAMLQCLL